MDLLTLEGEREVLQIPDWTVIHVEDLVLSVVLDQVVLDEFVVDDSWLDSLLVLLDKLLQLKLLLDVGLHWGTLLHFKLFLFT